MKIIRFKIYSLFAVILFLVACNSESDFPGQPGDPQISSKQVPSSAFFGDSIPFSAMVSDSKVPLSTLKAQLYYGEDKVSETVIRTKSDGNYQGKIYAPFFKNIPDGSATLKLVLQDIHFTIKEESFTVALQRPQYEFITFVSETGERLNLMRINNNLYKGTLPENMPRMLKGVFEAPKYGTNGNPITFGWQDGSIKEGTSSMITFISITNSPYDITFNSLTYERSPFTVYKLNGKNMNFIDNNFQIDIDLKKGDELVFENIINLNNYWIDPDFLTFTTDNKIKFAAIDGKYRVIANEGANPYFRIQTLDSSGNKATLKDDGSGAIWIAGWGIAKPGMTTGQPGWSPGNMLCMAPVAPKIYRMTAVASGEKGLGQIRSDWLGFKFFFQDNWGGEFNKAKYADMSGIIPTIISISDSGDLGLAPGQSLKDGTTYVITIDCTNGSNNAKISIIEKP